MSKINDIVGSLERKHASKLVLDSPTIDRQEYAAPLVVYSTSSPLPFGKALPNYPTALKQSDINRKQGIITAYLTVYKNDDGSPFIDPYNDEIYPGSFTKTIQKLDAFRKSSNNPWLCPNLWQHNREEIIGGIKSLTEDSRGVVYEAHLALGVRRAQEALELAEMKTLGSSYGYDPIHFAILPGNVRRLTEIGLREVSQVTFPANPLANFLDVKNDRFTSYPTYPRSTMQERSTSELATEMLSLFGKSNRPYVQRKDNYTYTVPNSNTSVTLNADGTITLNNVDHIDIDTGVALASMLYHLDALDDYSEPLNDSGTGTGAAMYGEEADRRRLALKDAEWRAKQRLKYRPWDASR